MEQKISSGLLAALKQRRGDESGNALPSGRASIELDPIGRTVVDITAKVIPGVLAEIESLGGEILNSSAQYRAIRARIPLEHVEPLTALPQVKFVRPPQKARTRREAPSR